jgi:hypothetical protein
MSTRQADNSSSLAKSTLYVRSPSHPPMSPQRVNSLSHLTQSAHPMVLPPCLRKLARYCACQVAPLSCFSKPTHLVGSPTRLFKYARQVGLPSHPPKSCHQVDCSSTLAKLTLCVFSSSHPIKTPHQGQPSCTLTKSLRQVASLSRSAHSPHQLATLSQLPMSARQADNSSSLTKSTLYVGSPSHTPSHPNGSTL